MARILYYGFIIPVSYLPFWVLYRISDLLYFILYKLIGYRTKIVRENIQKVFPEKPLHEKLEMESDFYRHFCDIMVEGIKGFSISNKNLDERYRFVNPDILDDCFNINQDVIVAAGHYCNWEWATIQSPRVLKHDCVGIYTPLTNFYFEQKMKRSRSRNGLILVPKADVKSYFSSSHATPQLYYFLVDQSPSNPSRAFWSIFLNRDTPIQYGIEKYSKEFNIPVYFLNIKRVKRGYYECKLSNVVSSPQELDYGQVIMRVYSKLEQMILSKPQWWLWSHRRWKHEKK